jgi:SAM-dependent methyltransferase
MANINDSFFDGFYKDIWKAIIPHELTVKEVDFMVQHFSLGPGSKVLDLMCGYGRHAIALAERGIHVTAIDNLESYTKELEKIGKERSLPMKVICDDICNYQSYELYDLVICMGNSLNFFEEDNILSIFKQVSVNLKPEGFFLINSWSISEIAIPNFKEKTWGYINELKVLTDSKFLFHPTRIESETFMINNEGQIEKRNSIDYIYSIPEIKRFMSHVAIEMTACFSIPPKKNFSLGDQRIYILGKRNL